MATERDDNEEYESENGSEAAESSGLDSSDRGHAEDERPSADEHEDDAPTHLGTTKYVQAAFFGAGILGAYLCGKILAAIWNRLAEWPTAASAVPQLLHYDETERATITIGVGAVIGLMGVIQSYRKAHIRQWANEVAIELSKVTWPDKETVTNGTIVVVIASAVAAVYIALLDKLWGFLSSLVYGV
jgi:preprotein translocase subunit SecE